jgi:CheY-like chemotaxis protein
MRPRRWCPSWSTGCPVPERFVAVIAGEITRSQARGRRVHAFGEVVALLAVDGGPAGTMLLEALWDGDGGEVRRARNGRDAIAILRNCLPRLIMLDLMMPLMDGWPVCAAQPALLGGAAQVPVIVLSRAREARAQTHEQGAPSRRLRSRSI